MWEKDANVTKFTNICRLCGCSSENSGGGKCSACGKGIGINYYNHSLVKHKFLNKKNEIVILNTILKFSSILSSVSPKD